MDRAAMLVAFAWELARLVERLDRRWPGTLKAVQTGGLSLVVHAAPNAHRDRRGRARGDRD